MPKNMDDMVKIKIIKKNANVAKAESIRPARVPPPMSPAAEPRLKKTKPRPRYMLWVVAAVSIVFLFFSLSYMFSSAYITIDPKIEDVIIDESLVAEKDTASSPVPFDLVVISGEETKKVEANEKK